MYNLKYISALLILVGILISCKNTDTEKPDDKAIAAKPEEKITVIYLVRHAEKAGTNPTNPDLSAAGKIRAEILKDSLIDEPLAAIYVSPYKRTYQTAAPIATAKNLQLTDYGPNDFADLVNKINSENQGKTVLVVGHSNTVLEIIETFGAKRPIPQLSDNDYNYLFKVTLPENGQPKAETSTYGN